jgi:hypothetical protein
MLTVLTISEAEDVSRDERGKLFAGFDAAKTATDKINRIGRQFRARS